MIDTALPSLAITDIPQVSQDAVTQTASDATPAEPASDAAPPMSLAAPLSQPVLFTPAEPVGSAAAQDSDAVGRLVEALHGAYVSIFGGLDETLADMVATMRREPTAYVAHLVTGVVGCVWEQVKGLLQFAVQAGEAVLTSAVCLLETAGETVGAYVSWLADPGDAPPQIDAPQSCSALTGGLQAVTDAVRKLRAWLADITPGNVVDLVAEAFNKALAWVAKLGLGEHMRALAREAAALGSFHGALVGMAVVTFVQPAEGLSLLLQEEGWLRGALAAQEAVAAASAEVFTGLRLAETAAVQGETLVRETSVVAKEAGALLRRTGTTRMHALDGPTMQRFAEALGSPEAVKLLESVYTSLRAELVTLRTEVLSHREMKRRLAEINRLVKTTVLSESAAVGRTAKEAAALASIRFEDELFESAHLVDDRIRTAAKGRLAADLDSLGWTSRDAMPAFAAPRAEHRTTLARLRSLGADVPEVEAQTITNQMMRAIVTESSTGADGALVVSESTFGHEVLRRTGAVYESKLPLTAWLTTRETLFQTYAKLIGEFRGTARYAELVDDWPSFQAWLPPL